MPCISILALCYVNHKQILPWASAGLAVTEKLKIKSTEPGKGDVSA